MCFFTCFYGITFLGTYCRPTVYFYILHKKTDILIPDVIHYEKILLSLCLNSQELKWDPPAVQKIVIMLHCCQIFPYVLVCLMILLRDIQLTHVQRSEVQL
jgi:hypothetical protein